MILGCGFKSNVSLDVCLLDHSIRREHHRKPNLLFFSFLKWRRNLRKANYITKSNMNENL